MSLQNQEDFSAEFVAKARAYWTPERTKQVTGGKKYNLLPSASPLMLRELGLLNADATMSHDSMRKFAQINHMLNLLEPHVAELAARHKVVRILDAGCGSSFLTTLLAWWFEQKSFSARILGIDTNSKLIQKSTRIAATLKYQSTLKFIDSQLSEIDWSTMLVGAFGKEDSTTKDDSIARPNMVVALHACDTATDDALALGLKEQADFIAVAPCCQAELANLWKNVSQAKSSVTASPMEPIFASPNLRREIASDMTDVLRILLLRGCGYEVTSTEFTSTAHTPKNRLITAVRRGRFLDSALGEYQRLKAHLGGGTIRLEALLPAEIRVKLVPRTDGIS